MLDPEYEKALAAEVDKAAVSVAREAAVDEDMLLHATSSADILGWALMRRKSTSDLPAVLEQMDSAPPRPVEVKDLGLGHG